MRFQSAFSVFVLLSVYGVNSAPTHIDNKSGANNLSTSGYLVQMKKPFTMEKLCSQDDRLRGTATHIRDGIKRMFSFGTFEGFSGNFTKESVQRMASNPLVEKIVPDMLVRAVDVVDIQYNAPPHLVRLSQDGPVQAQQAEYIYDAEFQGQNVNAYVIDSGVFVDHPEFEGRAENGPNFSDDPTVDDNVGHGTHVAGVIGSKTYGVAKQINIISVKVLDMFGQGSLSSVIAGLEFAVSHNKEDGLPGVANLSLGAAKSTVLDDAIRAAYEAGLIIVVAAGNSNIDACNTSPAGSKYAYTVGAIDDTIDRIASFSNWGRCVNMFSSGVEVKSLSNDKMDLKAIQTLSGTSMASPVLAGLIGTLLGKGVSQYDIPSELDDTAISNGIPRISLMLRPGSPNRIASNGYREYDMSSSASFRDRNITSVL
ncbi:hypothetical protein CANARDRAFT_27539 [[Candida] arabinofermentans NRRL YB-2248]|uniref:Peptidase S8/S53 domain-containing protein n=1 Tax=[Candida] arabinofermentans NRRL YB-2248 TaxID=983967 RepID=A0A1E4T3G8_9ASCO|nr:hypothetical protein CANARDRAFT_27539 [[Candida] arabinofermentans NRRL YB-2248]